jgi:hypothetical protein
MTTTTEVIIDGYLERVQTNLVQRLTDLNDADQTAFDLIKYHAEATEIVRNERPQLVFSHVQPLQRLCGELIQRATHRRLLESIQRLCTKCETHSSDPNLNELRFLRILTEIPLGLSPEMQEPARTILFEIANIEISTRQTTEYDVE